MNGVHAPFGLRPVRKNGGGLSDFALNSYAIASGYATNICYGDPVIPLADGTIGIGVAGSPALGVFMGCKYELATAESTGVTQRHSRMWPASTTVKTGTVVEAMILDDPNMVFEIQEAAANGTDAGTALALADRNLNANFAIGTPDTVLGNSGAVLNNASEAATNTLNLKILGLSPKVGNPLGSFAVWLVAWNTHVFKGDVAHTGL